MNQSITLHVTINSSLIVCTDDVFREKANLAVTLTNAKNEILAHAAFFDHPIGDLVDQACWEPLLHDHFSTEKCTVGITRIAIANEVILKDITPLYGISDLTVSSFFDSL